MSHLSHIIINFQLQKKKSIEKVISTADALDTPKPPHIKTDTSPFKILLSLQMSNYEIGFETYHVNPKPYTSQENKLPIGFANHISHHQLMALDH